MADRETRDRVDVDELRKELDTLREDLSRMRGDMGELLGTLSDMGKQTASDAGHRARNEVEQRLEQLHEAYDQARQRGQRTAHSMHKSMHEHPLTSLAIVFGTGVVLGSLLWRR